MKLNFSEFHPLDHWPGTGYCRSLPGGTRNHLWMAWHFHRREQVVSPAYKLLLCHIGRHSEQVWYRHMPDGTMRIWPTCRYCAWTRLPNEHDIDEGNRMPRFGPDED